MMQMILAVPSIWDAKIDNFLRRNIAIAELELNQYFQSEKYISFY